MQLSKDDCCVGQGIIMAPENLRLTLLVSLVLCSGLLVAFPVEPVLNTEAIFEDEADKRIREESIGNTSHSQLILTIRHDDGRSLTGDFDLVEKLMQLEKELITLPSSPLYGKGK